MMARLATLLCVLLSISVVSAAPREAFNGAVHSDFDQIPDDGMTETHVDGDSFAIAKWRDITLKPRFSTRKSWQPPQFKVEGTYVRLRGWFAADVHVSAGEVVFRLPPDAHPGRRENWKVELKGTERSLFVGTDGVVKLSDEMRAENWITLAGFAFNNRFAGDGGGVEAAKAALGEGKGGEL
jgi:hypothetical protein|tara:strand:+ start:3216 stop:3761 length:546 start_codon:yes stop_codon:yes gene_type:complete